MNGKDLYNAIGDINEKFIAEADATRGRKTVRIVTFAPWLKWAALLAACLVIAVAIAIPTILNNQAGNLSSGGNSPAAGAGSGSSFAPPSIKIDESSENAACYADPADWRGLATVNFVLEEKGVAADRMVFTSLNDLMKYADVWVVIPNVPETNAEGENMQTSIAEYAESIGDVLSTRQWDDHTVSTGNRILICQRLLSGCMMGEPSNLLREGGIYLLPVRFNTDFGAYEVIGDLDVLFELNDEGKIVSHSRYPDLNQYDGESFTRLLNDVRALYPTTDVEFSEHPISSVEQAEEQINAAYINSGYRKFSAEFEKETVIKGADVYLFKVLFRASAVSESEYGVIAKQNGAFIRGDFDANGEWQTRGGLGSFPKNS